MTNGGDTMRWFSNLILGVCATLTISAWAKGGDSARGKTKAGSCTACHGANGISIQDLWPNLAGQKEDYLFAQLKGFHEGTRINQLMNAIAKTLSNSDMEDLAAYFSQLKPVCTN